MKRAIRKYTRDGIAIVVLAVIALVVGGVILGHQRFSLPKAVPIVGSDFVKYKAEFSTVQSVTPGQGQTVNIAGVPVGEIANVDLVDGRAVVTMKIRRKYTPIYKDASALLRPKTGLNDMVIELTPGSKAAGTLNPDTEAVPVSQTLPNVNVDEILAGLDADTRDELRLLIGGAGQALGANGKNLSATLRRFEPTNRDILKITRLLAQRRQYVRRSIHNFKRVVTAIGDKDEQLSQLVDASNAVFRAFATQDAKLRDTLSLLPNALRETNRTLGKVDDLGQVLGPTLGALRPAARALGPSLRETRPFLQASTPIIRDHLRPFAREAQPTVTTLRPTVKRLADLTPDFTQVLTVANYLLNELAYNPPGSEEGYLFWLGWTNHLAPTLFATQDAHGPIRRGAILISCSASSVLTQLLKVNPQLATIIQLVNLPTEQQICTPQLASAAGNSG